MEFRKPTTRKEGFEITEVEQQVWEWCSLRKDAFTRQDFQTYLGVLSSEVGS